MSTKPSAQEIEHFILRSFPTDDGSPLFLIEALNESHARVRLLAKSSHLRPGATVSGPIQMTLADTAAWVLVMHNLGFSYAPSVTSNLNISFLCRPEPRDLIGEANLLKLGKRLSVAEVRILSDGKNDPVAHATVTYALIQSGERKS